MRDITAEDLKGYKCLAPLQGERGNVVPAICAANGIELSQSPGSDIGSLVKAPSNPAPGMNS